MIVSCNILTNQNECRYIRLGSEIIQAKLLARAWHIAGIHEIKTKNRKVIIMLNILSILVF